MASMPQLDVSAILSRLDAIGADIAETRRIASDGAAASTAAALTAFRAQLEAKEGLITALRAQVSGLQARVTAEGAIPASCVVRSETYKSVTAELDAARSNVSHMEAQLLQQASLAQAQRDTLQAQLGMQLEAANSCGESEIAELQHAECGHALRSS